MKYKFRVRIRLEGEYPIYRVLSLLRIQKAGGIKECVLQAYDNVLSIESEEKQGGSTKWLLHYRKDLEENIGNRIEITYKKNYAKRAYLRKSKGIDSYYLTYLHKDGSEGLKLYSNNIEEIKVL